MNRYLAWTAGVTRAPFLALIPPCVGLGLYAALLKTDVRAFDGVLALLGALCAHMSVNAFNEYADFRNGLDFHTARTPFSGGSGTLPANPQAAGFTLALAAALVFVCVCIGFWFLAWRGAGLLLCGLPGVFLVLSYSHLLVRRPVLCLLAPGLGFGPAMVMGTEYALSGAYSWTGALLSLVPMGAASALLVFNQIPDAVPDAAHGRCNLVVRYGVRAGVVAGVLMWALALAAALGFAIARAHAGALGALPGFVLAAVVCRRALLLPESSLVVSPEAGPAPEALQKWLGLNVAAVLLSLWGLAAGALCGL